MVREKQSPERPDEKPRRSEVHSKGFARQLIRWWGHASPGGPGSDPFTRKCQAISRRGRQAARPERIRDIAE